MPNFLINQLSVCHFAPVTRTFFTKSDKVGTTGVAMTSGTHALCSYCQQPCQVISDLPIDRQQLELTARRFKDGDAEYADLQDIVLDLTRDALHALLKDMGAEHYPDYEAKIKKSALQK